MLGGERYGWTVRAVRRVSDEVAVLCTVPCSQLSTLNRLWLWSVTVRARTPRSTIRFGMKCSDIPGLIIVISDWRLRVGH